MRINFTWKSLIPILMIVKQCTHFWGLRNTLTLAVSSLDQPHEDGDLRSMTPVKAHGLLGVILSAPASTSCHLSQPFCNLSPISNRIPPQPHLEIVLRVSNNSDCLVFITPFLGFPILCAGHVCLSCKCDIDFKCMYLGRLVAGNKKCQCLISIFLRHSRRHTRILIDAIIQHSSPVDNLLSQEQKDLHKWGPMTWDIVIVRKDSLNFQEIPLLVSLCAPLSCDRQHSFFLWTTLCLNSTFACPLYWSPDLFLEFELAKKQSHGTV